jgi:para-aminobenzoate synthetase / 4-amino-4-deoxychorismate lyase
MYDNLRVWMQRRDGGWLRFARPKTVLVATTPAETPGVLERAAAAAAAGRYAAGFVAYEAAQAFDTALRTHAPGTLPLAVFGVYADGEPHAALPAPTEPCAVDAWRPAVGAEAYGAALERIRAYLAAGDTYQVNYTLRLRSRLSGDPYALFHRLAAAQAGGRFAACLACDAWAVCSASPELFFDYTPPRIVCRPMKGTAPRGLWSADDRARAVALRDSEKERAENVMIVDMIRNDLGRIATPGSVRVTSAFDVEQYPTLWQLTSTVEAETHAGIPALFRALYPCASVTGAPKVRTMEIIRELEPEPRGVYTGAIGLLEPGGGARFSVAIRTVAVDRHSGNAEYGVGGGIVWDSLAEREYAECVVKARVLDPPAESFALLETLLWTPRDGFVRLEGHLRRAEASAAYFGFAFSAARVRRALRARTMPEGAARVRVEMDRVGGVRITAALLDANAGAPPTVAVDDRPVDAADPFLYHKTTRRGVYAAARARHPAADDVLLYNARGEITESTIANVVVERGEERVTPPLSCGLLPGVYREDLLRRGRVREAVVRREDLRRAAAVYLVNSLRGERRVTAIQW